MAEVLNPEKTSWIEIELVDPQGKPVTGLEYLIETPDGSEIRGTLDSNGRARVEGLDPGTCDISFPTLDQDTWDKA